MRDEGIFKMLNSLGIQIEKHWREHRPKMVAALEKAGHLQEALETAERLTLDAEIAAIQNGLTPDQARELYREQWAFLPSEEDAPDLSNGNPALWRAPAKPGSTTALPIKMR